MQIIVQETAELLVLRALLFPITISLRVWTGRQGAVAGGDRTVGKYSIGNYGNRGKKVGYSLNRQLCGLNKTCLSVAGINGDKFPISWHDGFYSLISRKSRYKKRLP
jgi:hypothetical protein